MNNAVLVNIFSDSARPTVHVTTGATGNRQPANGLHGVRKKPPDPSKLERSRNHGSVTDRSLDTSDVSPEQYKLESLERHPRDRLATADVPVRPGGGARTLAGAAVRRPPPAALGEPARGEPGRGFL